MTKERVEFDKNGMLIPQKVNYEIEHDEDFKELIEKIKKEVKSYMMCEDCGYGGFEADEAVVKCLEDGAYLCANCAVVRNVNGAGEQLYDYSFIKIKEDPSIRIEDGFVRRNFSFIEKKLRKKEMIMILLLIKLRRIERFERSCMEIF